MGIFKWVMKHGPGNVGSLAKTQAKIYNHCKKQYPQLSQDELLRHTLGVRLAAGAMLGDAALSEAEQEEMIKGAEGSLAKLTMQIAIYENPDVGGLPQKTFNEMFDVIEEVIAKHADEEPSVRSENTEEQFHEAHKTNVVAEEEVQETTHHKTSEPTSERVSSRKGSMVATIVCLALIIPSPIGVALMWSHKHFSLWARITISVWLGLAIFIIMGLSSPQGKPTKTKPDAVLYPAKTPSLTQDKQEILSTEGNLTAAHISRKYSPAVVSIINQGRYGAISGIGSGFVINEKGVIVTNHHCVEGAHTLSVEFLTEDLPRTAKVIATDKGSDIAILKTDKPAPTAVTLGNSDTITIGEEIVVIGTPKGLVNTVSNGIISSIREGDILQISAPISKGSSGSPVFNMRGQVIGMVFGILEAGQNLNFAVPINKVKELLPAQTVVVESPVEIVEETEAVFDELPQLNLPVDGKVYALKHGDYARNTKFHRPNCDIIQGVSRTDLFSFSSRSDAEKYHATPCKLCFKDADFKKLPEPAIEAKAAPKKKEAFITIGSSKADVAEVLGAPDKMDVYSSTEYWHYGFSSITFRDGKVHEYNQNSILGKDLKIRLIPEQLK